MSNSWKAGIVLAVAVAIVLVFSFKPGSKRLTSPGASGSLPAVTEVAPQIEPEPQPSTPSPSPPEETAAREEDAVPTPPATATRPDTASETASETQESSPAAPAAGSEPAEPVAQIEPKPEETVFTEESKLERLPRLVEIGAEKCFPCQMMQPILAELRQEYAGKLQVDMVDVWKHPEQADEYGIQSIPTQIIYDSSGEEVFRHLGFYPKGEILAKFKELGINLE